MPSEIKKEIKNLNLNKASIHNNIPPKILQQGAKVTETLCSYTLTKQYQTVRQNK